MQKTILNDIKELKGPEINFFYTKHLTYRSLKRSLRKGIAKKEKIYIKSFACPCRKHKGLMVQALVGKNCDTLQINKCELSVAAKKGLAIDSEGRISIDGYRFYSAHPEWKVRASVAIGLGKMQDKNALGILSNLLKDKHYGVKLATIQALEASKIRSSINILKDFTQESGKHIHRVVIRALERVRFGINAAAIIGQTLNKIQSSKLLLKIYHASLRQNKILVPHHISHRILDNKEFRRYFNHWDNFTDRYNAFRKFAISNNHRIPIPRNRISSKIVIANKKKYITGLFFRNYILVESIQDIKNSVKGEIYWATTDSTDPKATRPVLITNSIKAKPGYYLVAPLTTKNQPFHENNIKVNFSNKQNFIQLTRQKMVHKSSLLNKYGNLPKAELMKILSIQKKGLNISTEKPKGGFRKQRKIKNYPIKHSSEVINIDSAPTYLEKLTPEPEVSKIKNHTLLDFLKPEDQVWLFGITGNTQTTTNVTSSSSSSVISNTNNSTASPNSYSFRISSIPATNKKSSTVTTISSKSKNRKPDIFEVLKLGKNHVREHLPNLKEQLNKVDSQGRSPLLYALDRSVSAKTIERLIEAGCNRDEKDNQGRSFNSTIQINPLKRYKKLLPKLFPKQSLQASISLLPLATNLSQSLASTSNTSQIHAALPNHHKQIFKIAACTNMGTAEKVIARAIANNINLNMQNPGKKGFTPLMLALEKKNYPCAELLIKYGANWSAVSKKGKSADYLIKKIGIPAAEVSKIKSTAN